MRKECKVETFKQPNERGILIDSVRVQCPDCQTWTTAFGTAEKSLKRCLWLMTEECWCVGRHFFTGNLPVLPAMQPPTDPGFFSDEPDLVDN